MEMYLLRRPFTCTIPLPCVVNISKCSALLGRVEWKKMDLCDSSPCLHVKIMSKLYHFIQEIEQLLK